MGYQVKETSGQYIGWLAGWNARGWRDKSDLRVSMLSSDMGGSFSRAIGHNRGGWGRVERAVATEAGAEEGKENEQVTRQKVEISESRCCGLFTGVGVDGLYVNSGGGGGAAA